MVCQSWHQKVHTAHTQGRHKQEWPSCHLSTNEPVAAMVALAVIGWMDCVVEIPAVS